MLKKNYALALTASIAIFTAGFWAGGRGAVLFESGQAVAAVAPATGVTKTVLFEADHSWDGTPYGAYPAGNADIKIVKIVIPPILAWAVTRTRCRILPMCMRAR